MTTPDEVENPLNAFQSITSSGSASYHMSVSRMSASTMSMVAATLKSNSQVINRVSYLSRLLGKFYSGNCSFRFSALRRQIS